MKREDVKKQIPGITEEQLNWIMAENGNDVNREKTAAEQYKTQLENTQAQLKTAQDGLAAFDGVVIFYTHGHMYGVKYDLDTLADAASARGAEVALFGHTHIPHAETRSKVFLFNPGSCGRCYTGPNTYGVLTLDQGKIISHEHKEVPHS